MSWLTGGEGWQGAMSLLAHAEALRHREGGAGPWLPSWAERAERRCRRRG